MAKKKTEPVPDPAPGQTSDTANPNREQATAVHVGLVPTAVPQTPAAAEARDALLKAITSEAIAITKAKDKTQSAAQLESLARAYTLVAADHQVGRAPAVTRSLDNSSTWHDASGDLPLLDVR